MGKFTVDFDVRVINLGFRKDRHTGQLYLHDERIRSLCVRFAIERIAVDSCTRDILSGKHLGLKVAVKIGLQEMCNVRMLLQ